jgi:hypothetical protein
MAELNRHGIPGSYEPTVLSKALSKWALRNVPRVTGLRRQSGRRQFRRGQRQPIVLDD